MREQHEQATLHGTMSQEPEGAPLSPSSPLRHVPDWDVREGQCKGTGDMQGGAPPPPCTGKTRLNSELYLVASGWLDPIFPPQAGGTLTPDLGGGRSHPDPLHQLPRVGGWELAEGSERGGTSGITVGSSCPVSVTSPAWPPPAPGCPGMTHWWSWVARGDLAVTGFAEVAKL